jgi:soluble lytic murein transglycosylase-like protein
MSTLTLRTIGLSRYPWILLFAVPSVSLAEIFVSTDVNGLQKWSTQAIDVTYTKTSIVEDQAPAFATVSQPLGQSALKIKMTIPKSIVNRSKPKNAKLVLFHQTITDISNKYGVDPELVEALVAVESGFNTHAISPKGARGLMQLMPATAKRYGMKNEQELHIPAKNIDMGVRHLKDLLNLHNGQISLAIASYNAGQGAVSKYGQRIPQYRETMMYVPAVLVYMARSADVNQEFKQE